jgi:serine/threonine-protein kinase RsbW
MLLTRRENAIVRGSAAYRTTQEVIDLLRPLEEAMTAADFPQKDVFGVRLALEEALINAIKHGHRYDETKVAHFRYEVTHDRITAEIEDQGPGFDPTAVPDPLDDANLDKASGRGLLLMRAYMTSVHFNVRGNRVMLCKMR